MPRRMMPIVTDQIYHVITKSRYAPAPFIVEADYHRMIAALKFYRFINRPGKFSNYLHNMRPSINIGACMVDIVAFCIMPNHIHLLLRQNTDGGISNFMSMLLNSYTKYFNLKYKRQGPIWEKRFKDVLIENDEQLLHVTRYIHLNPVTAFLTDDPYDWEFSSYREYINTEECTEKICNYSNLIDMQPARYKTFCISNIKLQRQVSRNKIMV
ncbi:MAG: transposase [Candidatus Omnitrophica bacterium]|nr:transposase [Candidatus Omnitrophota bacterium]